MKLFFYTEARLIKAKDGNFYNPEGVQNKGVFKRYLNVFESVCIVARVRQDIEYTPVKSEIVNTDKIHVYEIPYYVGLKDYFFKRTSVKKRIKKLVSQNKFSAHILRLPGNLGTIASKYLKKNNIKYGVEVVGDPFDVFDTKIYKNPLLFLVKYKSYFDLKKIVKDSWSALYVTKHTLPKRYPAKKIIEKNTNIYFILCGKGVKENLLKTLAPHELNNILLFENRSDIPKFLNTMNCFYFPSLTEGQPNSLIEAMVMGLPIVASNIEPIKETVPVGAHKYLIPPLSVDDAVEKFWQFMIAKSKYHYKTGQLIATIIRFYFRNFTIYLNVNSFCK